MHNSFTIKYLAFFQVVDGIKNSELHCGIDSVLKFHTRNITGIVNITDVNIDTPLQSFLLIYRIVHHDVLVFKKCLNTNR